MSCNAICLNKHFKSIQQISPPSSSSFSLQRRKSILSSGRFYVGMSLVFLLLRLLLFLLFPIGFETHFQGYLLSKLSSSPRTTSTSLPNKFQMFIQKIYRSFRQRKGSFKIVSICFINTVGSEAREFFCKKMNPGKFRRAFNVCIRQFILFKIA